MSKPTRGKASARRANAKSGTEGAALFAGKDFETPPAIARATGQSPDSVVANIKSGKLKAHNMGSQKKPRYRIHRDQWSEYLENTSTAGLPYDPRKNRPKRQSKVIVPSLV